MKNSLCKAQYVLLVLFLFALSACGTSSTLAPKADGKIAASLVYKDSTGKSVGLVAGNGAQVTKTRLVVTGPDIPTAKKLFDGNTGGTIEVYPGSKLIVTALAYDSTGALVYEGAAVDQTIASGETKNLTIQLNPPVIKAEDQSCLGCHESTRDITGQNLIADYKQSGHYSNEFWTLNQKNGSKQTGCAGCHGTQHNDLSPAESGRCFECHGSLGSKHTNASAITAGDAYSARYLNNATNNCSACHEPHNPLYGAGAEERKEWAESGHGNVDGVAWKHYNFNNPDRGACVRCHTPDGFVRGIGDNWTSTAPLSSIANTKAKQVLTCNACHSSNDFKNSVRTLQTAFVLPYTASAGVSNVFPAGSWLGNSQLCVPCHSSMNGASSGGATSHYMAAAATMFVKNGFVAFTSASAPVKVNGVSASTSASSNVPLFTSAGVFRAYTSIPKGYVYTYAKTLTANSDGGAVGSTHRILGTPAMAQDSHTAGQGLVTGGPCVTCHMGNGTANHTWEISAESFTTVCSKCHSSEGGVALTTANYKTLFIEEQAVPFSNALKAGFNNLSTNYHVAYNSAAYPYYYKAGTRGAVDWTLGGTLSAAQQVKLKGAAFNLQMLDREPAAFAHARTYARRLLYDSLDFLDDGAINMTVITGLSAKFPAIFTISSTATLSSESTKYLKAYNRTNNRWYSSERP